MFLRFTRRIFGLFLVISLPSAVLAKDGNGLWVEGKDQPQSRVNIGVASLKPDVYLKVSEKVRDAVVNISTTKTVKSPRNMFQWRGSPRGGGGDQPAPFDNFFGRDFFDRFFGSPGQNPQPKQSSLGSGFILNSQGYIVTNNHVVEKADEIKVILANESEYKAKLIGRDPKTDVALLKIKPKKNARLKSVILGNSEKMKVGEVVIAIGNPFGLSHSVTQGIISAKERSIGIVQYDDFIQTDASINPGNSGGPLLNLYGEVIGINTAIVATGQGIGFAIPINLAKSILLELKKEGKVTRGWLGVLIQKVTQEHATALKLKDRKGALVAEVVKDGPAEKGGLKAGDVIVRFDRKIIEDSGKLPLVVANTRVGKTVKVEVIRDGERKGLKVKIAKLEDTETQMAEADASDSDQLGLLVQALTPEMARSLGVDEDLKGVLVADVNPESSAYRKGVRRGDIILEVNRKKVEKRSDYVAATSKLKKGDTVLILVKKNRQTHYIAFTL